MQVLNKTGNSLSLALGKTSSNYVIFIIIILFLYW